MYAKDHTLAGAAIGISITSPVAACILAIASHIALDTLGERAIPFGKTTDVAAVAILCAFLAHTQPPETLPAIFAAMIAANLPDIWDTRGYLTYINRKRWPHLHHWPCHNPPFPFINLTAWQTAAFSAALYAAFFVVM